MVIIMSKSRNHLSKDDKKIVSEMYHNQHESVKDLADTFGSNRRTINRIINDIRYIPKGNGVQTIELDQIVTPPLPTVKEVYVQRDPDLEIVEHNVKMANQLQRTQDLNRVKNKAYRDQARVLNAVNAYQEELISRLNDNNLSHLTVQHNINGDKPVGIIQLSDLHLGEVIELETNQFNFDIASKRLRKLVNRAKTVFKSEGIEKVLIAFTGDISTSDRRVSELLSNATNRSNSTFVAVDILQQFILDLNQDFNITVASITGNESRIADDIDWSDPIALDNYDATIHNMLAKIFEGSKGVKFFPILNPLESVVEVNGKHILLIHGHNNIASNGNIEPGVNKLITRYALGGVTLDYVLLGHVHLSNISDFYARSAGLPGGSAYSERGLNLISKAAQNIFIVRHDAIDGHKVDLQNVDGIQPYTFNEHLAEPTSTSTSGISICKV